MLDSPGGDLRAIVEPESVEHLRHVICGRPNRDDQLLGDLAVGATLRDQSHDLPLTRRELLQRPPARARRAWQAGARIRLGRVAAYVPTESASHGPQVMRLFGEPLSSFAQLRGLGLESLGLCVDICQEASDSRCARVRNCVWLVFNQEQRHRHYFCTRDATLEDWGVSNITLSFVQQ